ncbi:MULTISPECIES: DUF2842 domain-containing protein [unclassified Roseivivax]|uniref:DUF2842 domain-containing protein n=1 Tax=Roseivivax sp. GX 12232 TaxID=2900547 RepID=UPI001E448E7D|nr:DUF2842 domain-containing protein [Roseivivax sp. GX 12232]MCE0505290.1 DUF2842 domain-containing protein [Roseivivax sp. GX 12232]
MPSHKTKKRLAILILVVGLPVYAVVASSVMTWLDRPPILLELLIYAALGVIWALPFRWVFLGVGQPDPEAPREDQG